MNGGPDRHRRSETRLLRGYGPLLGIVAAFLAMALLAPTVAPEERVTSSRGGPSAGVGGDGSVADGGEAVGTDGTVDAGGAVNAPAAQVATCDGPQIPNDPYSPPCFSFSGDNGGATAPGVSGDTITVALRDSGGPYDVGAVVAQLTGKSPSGRQTTRDDFVRTYSTLIEYFNKHFQFYGRKLKLEVFRGKGSLVEEILGGGQANANADAIQEAQQLHAFADVTVEAPVFAEALQKQGVISTNPIYPSRSWYQARSPYSFGRYDCSKVVDYVTEMVIKQMANKPVIAGEFKGQPRKYGIVYPQTPIYQECGEQARKAIADAGIPATDYKLYTLSLEGIPSAAGPITSQFANEGITTVLLICDPLMPYFMTTNATQAGWFPEWINTGIAYMDADWAGQLFDAAQWKNSFGISLNGETQPARGTYGYAAYQSIDPTTSPDPLLVAPIYYQLYILAAGIQMAGPNLSPETFASGLHRYESPGVGPQGRWGFQNGDFTAARDARIIWWDPKATSNYNGAAGAYRDNGQRYTLGTLPEGTPPVQLVG